MIRRGDVFLVDFGERHGPDPSGVRPAVVVQNDVGNRHAPTVIVAAVSSRGIDRVFPVECRVDPPEGGFTRPSKVDCGLLASVDRDRLRQRLGRLDPESMPNLDRCLAASLGLPLPGE